MEKIEIDAFSVPMFLVGAKKNGIVYVMRFVVFASNYIIHCMYAMYFNVTW